MRPRRSTAAYGPGRQHLNPPPDRKPPKRPWTARTESESRSNKRAKRLPHGGSGEDDDGDDELAIIAQLEADAEAASRNSSAGRSPVPVGRAESQNARCGGDMEIDEGADGVAREPERDRELEQGREHESQPERQPEQDCKPERDAEPDTVHAPKQDRDPESSNEAGLGHEPKKDPTGQVPSDAVALGDQPKKDLAEQPPPADDLDTRVLPDVLPGTAADQANDEAQHNVEPMDGDPGENPEGGGHQDDDAASETSQLSGGFYQDLKSDLCIDMDNLVEILPLPGSGQEMHGVPESEMRDLRHTVMKWLAQDKDIRPASHFYYRLTNVYTEDKTSLQDLVGRDRTLVDIFVQLTARMPLEIFLAVLDCEEQSFLVRRLVNLEGLELVRDMLVDNENVVSLHPPHFEAQGAFFEMVS